MKNGERERESDSHILKDLFDGKVWKDFLVYKGKPFLSNPGNYGLMLNFDFFQPYKHVPYSVGVIYLTVMNLPRELRYKQETL